MRSNRIYQYAASFSGTIALVAFGMNSAWSSPYLPKLQSNSSDIPTTITQGSWCAVAPLCGCIFGALLALNIVDKLGRKKSLLFIAPVTIASLVTMALIKNIWYIIASRFVVGITDGAFFTILPMYIGEITEPEVRGFSSTLMTSFFFLGSFIINATGPFLSIGYTSFINSLFPLIHFVTFIFMPESPYYFVKSEKYELAAKSLKKLKAPEHVDKELNYLKACIESEGKSDAKPKFTDLFTIPSNRRACFIFCTVLSVSRLSAKTPLTLFTTTIFQESGSTLDPTLSVIIYCAIEVIITTNVAFVVNHIGKKILVIFSGIGCSLTLGLLAVYFFLKEKDYSNISSLYWVPITALILHNISYSMGSFGLLSYVSELFPMNVKRYAACLTEILSVTLGIATSQFFHITYTNFGMSVPLFSFSILCAIGNIFNYKILPETKGKSLEEIQDILKGKHLTKDSSTNIAKNGK